MGVGSEKPWYYSVPIKTHSYACYECFYPLGSYPLLRRKSDFAKLTQKKNAAISKKITTLSKSCSVLSRTFLFALFFDFGNLFCRCGHNPYARIAHTVKERVKLPPLRVLLWRRFQKELVYGYIVAEHKLKEYLQTWVLPLVFNVRKVVRWDKHLIANFLSGFPASCPCSLDCSPKSLKIISWYWSFWHICSPYCIVQFTFLIEYVYTVTSIGLNNYKKYSNDSCVYSANRI